MFNTPFYHGIIRNYVIVFGTLFNNIHITRKKSDNSDKNTIKVPIAYGPRDKYLARNTDINLDREVAIIFPRMSFVISDLTYDPVRVKNATNRIYDLKKGNTTYQPVPYKGTFELTVMSNNIEDTLKIVEQILPYFTPNWQASLKMFDEFPQHITDISINLDAVTPDDTYEGDFKEHRTVTWTLVFTMEMWFYQHFTTPKIIKIAKTSLWENEGDLDYFERIQVYPGLDANGNPTTDANVAINYLDVNSDDNYDYVISIDENIQ